MKLTSYPDNTLHEVERNLVEHDRATAAQARYRRGRMEAALPDALVTGYEPLIPVMANDPKDRHVLAAAVRAGVRLIVTENVRDFPASACAPYDIEVRRADAFLLALFDAAPEAIERIIRKQAADLRRPPQAPAQVLARLARTAPTFAHGVYRRLDPTDPAP